MPIEDDDDDNNGLPEWDAKMYTMDLLWTELRQMREADLGEIRNTTTNRERYQFYKAHEKLANRLVTRFQREAKEYQDFSATIATYGITYDTAFGKDCHREIKRPYLTAPSAERYG